MVGLLPLEQCILVRIQVSEPSRNALTKAFFVFWTCIDVISSILEGACVYSLWATGGHTMGLHLRCSWTGLYVQQKRVDK